MKRIKKLAVLAVLAALVIVGAAWKSYQDATGGFLNETRFVNATNASTGSSSITPIDLGSYASGAIVINVTAISGTSPSLTVNFQTCDTQPGTQTAPSNSNCVTHTAGSAITATGLQVIKVDHFARWNTVNYTITGTTPQVSFTVDGYFKPTS
jgi:hypothetical protein